MDAGPGVIPVAPVRAMRGEHLMVYTSHAQNNWARASGEVMGWDGDTEYPTLSPSLEIPGQWHGFLEGGILRNA